MKVFLRGGGRTHELTGDQTWLLAKELGKVLTTRSSTGVLPRVAPDCTIEIRGTGWQEDYELYGRSVLRSVATDESWQFYFGFVIADWLYK
jgi:hypothetical protein